MSSSEPSRSDRVGFIGMNDVELAGFYERGNLEGRRNPGEVRGDPVDTDTSGLCTIAQRGTVRRNQLRLVTARLEAFQHQESLILPAAPFGVQVHDQNLHELAAPRWRFDAISFPSLAYFKRTDRAAIWEISAPR